MGGIAAIILAAGVGARMKSATPKQFLQLAGKPVFLYSLKAFDELADRIVLVTGRDWFDWCEEQIASEKLRHSVQLVEGGKTRYESSLAGVKAVPGCDILMIHDAARACVSREVIEASIRSAREKGSGVAAVPLKDTVKEADGNGEVIATPDRSRLRIIQTPQSFTRELILPAFSRLEEALNDPEKTAQLDSITDDAMLVERFTGHPVFLSQGSYENIKLTTPEDLLLAEAFLKRREKNAQGTQEGQKIQ